VNSDRYCQLSAWSQLRSRLEVLLYDYDPDGMGASVGAPLDEYADVAISVIRTLRDREPDQPVSDAVWEAVPGASLDLIEEIAKAWGEYHTGS